ncbi:outer membrane protein assembly factor BamA [Neisseria sp. N95_16]|uniref:Outer membrane protein assembly factor BamA n=1 Tax=Neisseria brasiliensis TaxID=2666100 RepID=A0A5Q3S0G0_9NEIS|nr:MULTISPECIES: outer membrane protein assembly factor BamA [Neisseria]MRN37960.1 outer membrane protein assembly factor BamA [Neisseria brasiliensis]PJO10816.1 outer membrane protein assembly factor BamA [Neisseria sp. N95_16]PJO78950.1 outer membrane protein assembly factor BamA [Neisseria sp. N177_16]QGL24903.1 outer membrane protein assembly factor BamA [Neisseria brasiliensis]
MKLKQIASALMMLGLAPLALADFTIQDIRVEGLQRTEPSTVFNYLPVKVGDNFSDERSEEIIRNLYATGFFDDVRVETLGNQVLLTVVERPTIATLNITGAKMLQNDAIKKNLEAFGLAQSQYFNQATLNQAIAGLKQEYMSRGKQSVEIKPTVTKLARNRVAIDIAVEEGKTTKITNIEFEGNEKYSDRKLMKQMSLSEGGMWTWLTKSNQFNEQKFAQDMQRVNDFYQNNGYFGFRILDTDIQTNEDKTQQTIKVVVDEGERFRWGKVHIEGDTREVPKEDLYKLLKMKEGKWYERQQMVTALEGIQNRMGSAGYAFSEVNVQPQPNPETKVVDFVLHIEPGRKVYVNEINITGNNKTRDEVIRRELRQMEAAPYDTSKLQRSKERVELLGYFDNVQFDAKPVAGTPDQVDLNMSLTERSTGSLDLSAGWVQDTGMVVSAGVAQDNLFGTGKSASARLSRSKTTLNGSLSFTDPYFTPDGVSLGYDIYGRKYDPRKASSSAKQYQTTTVGGGLRMGVPITEYDRVNFGLAAEHLKVNTYTGAPKRYKEFMQDHTGSEIGSYKGWLYKGTIGWGRNKTDNALWPTRGYMTGINGEVALPGSDLKYYTLTHNQTWFFPLSKDLTLMLGGEVGYGNSYGNTKTMPFFENFYGGGLGSVRGFESGTLGPKVYDEYGDKISYGGNRKANVSAELLFPMPGIKDARTVRLSMFADAGSVWDGKTYGDKQNDNGNNVYGLGVNHKSTFKEELRYSAGAAVTWLSPLGPMKFSYAYPIKKKEGDEIQRFQFQLGTTF